MLNLTVCVYSHKFLSCIVLSSNTSFSSSFPICVFGTLYYVHSEVMSKTTSMTRRRRREKRGTEKKADFVFLKSDLSSLFALSINISFFFFFQFPLLFMKLLSWILLSLLKMTQCSVKRREREKKIGQPILPSLISFLLLFHSIHSTVQPLNPFSHFLSLM